MKMVISLFFILGFFFFFFFFLSFFSLPFWRPPWQHAPRAARPPRPSLGTPLSCPRLDVASEFVSGPAVLSTVSTHAALGQWEAFLHYRRFYLLEWCDLLSQAAFPVDVIDSLC